MQSMHGGHTARRGGARPGCRTAGSRNTAARVCGSWRAVVAGAGSAAEKREIEQRARAAHWRAGWRAGWLLLLLLLRFVVAHRNGRASERHVALCRLRPARHGDRISSGQNLELGTVGHIPSEQGTPTAVLYGQMEPQYLCALLYLNHAAHALAHRRLLLETSDRGSHHPQTPRQDPGKGRGGRGGDRKLRRCAAVALQSHGSTTGPSLSSFSFLVFQRKKADGLLILTCWASNLVKHPPSDTWRRGLAAPPERMCRRREGGGASGREGRGGGVHTKILKIGARRRASHRQRPLPHLACFSVPTRTLTFRRPRTSVLPSPKMAMPIPPHLTAAAMNITDPDLATAWNKIQTWGPYGYRVRRSMGFAGHAASLHSELTRSSFRPCSRA